MVNNLSYERVIMRILSVFLVLSILMPSASFAFSEKLTRVEQEVRSIEEQLSARIGVAVFNTETGEHWNYRGEERFPLTSTFKTIACAKLLHDSEQGDIDPLSKVKIEENDLVTYSPIIEQYVGQEITLDDACQATMSTSDNTAANMIIKAVGGTESITSFIRAMGDEVTRLDRIEPDLNQGLLNDLRDTTTPNAMVITLHELLFGSVLSESSQQKLLTWMINNQVTDNLLRSVLPNGWGIGDRSGAGGCGARSITAIVWSKTQSPIIISIYIAQTEASIEQRNQAIVKIGKAIFDNYIDSNDYHRDQ